MYWNIVFLFGRLCSAQFCNMFHITNETTDCANSSKQGRCKVPSGGQTM